MMDKAAIAGALREMGTMMQIKGENPFKIRAFETGAQAIDDLEDDLGVLVDEGRLTQVRGIGAALAARIAELHLTGRCAALEEMRRELPAGFPDLMQVPDLGPKKIAALHKALGIQGVADLKLACQEGRVRAVKGFGEKTERKILDGITRFEDRDERLLLSQALPIGDQLIQHLRASPLVLRAEIAGSLRRGQETIGDIDIVVAMRGEQGRSELPELPELIDHLQRFPSCSHVVRREAEGWLMRLSSGVSVDLWVVGLPAFATALHGMTGSSAHLLRLRDHARERGLTVLPAETEEELYRQLGLAYIPPELREDQGEVEAARDGTLPRDLIALGDIQGMVHCHTTYSDGKNSIEEMALAADALGMRYLTLTDHSQAAFYASGVKPDRLKAQWDEIARVQEKVKVKLLRGTESDILVDGALDYPDEILEQMDVVIASIHSRMKMDEETMTRRLVTAMRHPLFKIWGHALGRLLQQRPPFACRVEEVLDAIATSRAAIEINGDPHRLDMEPRWLREARKRGIRFVISTDAHSVADLQNLPYGVATARRGWVRRGEVLNALPVDAFLQAVRPGNRASG